MTSTKKEISMVNLLPILIGITQSLRSHPEIKKASAGRGTLAFFELLRSLVVLNGQRVTKNYIKKAALVTLPHRIAVNSLRPSEEIVEEIIDQVLDNKETSISILPPSEVPLTQNSQTENNALLRELMKFVGQKNKNQQPSSALRPVLRSLHPDFPGYFTQQTHGFTIEDLAKLLQMPRSELEKQYPTLSNFFSKLKQLYQSQTPSQELMSLLHTLPNQLERLGFIRGMNEHNWHPSAIFTFTPTAIDLVGKDLVEQLLGAAFGKLVLESEMEQVSQANQTITEDVSKNLFRELLEAIQTIIDQRGLASPQSLLNESNVKSLIEERLRERLQVEPDLLRYDHLLAALDELQTLLEKLELTGYVKLKDKITLTTKAYALLFEELIPEVEKIVSKSQEGHRSKKIIRKIGERSLDIRPYKNGDNYRDISIQRTIKTLVRQGKQLDAIKRKDFQIYQKNPPTNMAIAVALDISSSMGEFQKLYYARKAAVGLTYAAQRKGDKVGVITFSDQARVLTQLSLDVNLILNKVFQQRADGNTNIQEALLLSRHL
ncbi:VWA domain-containing protein [Candidatus Borrarchaeum sp.]|uniref:VWA domain-containing protein n=1 Tax=Candidatus Borrarchaeum sp. TaxID=2846742 RepID=UPI002579734B|nr:VWA domain-containing protein [Candidatus Borrarchaeum sp.]